MGNCLIMISSDTDLYAHMNLCGPLFTSSYSHTQASSFTPILPFCTRSHLGSFYNLGYELGRDRYGIIRSCICRPSGASFACKSISKRHLSREGDVEGVVREIRIMKLLSNPHCRSSCSIVRFHDVVEEKSFIHLILELCRGGELYERIVTKKCYSEVRAAIMMKSLLETVQYCHSVGIMHRDIKPENILLVEDSDASPIKLADFGLALEFSAGQKFSGIAGSSYYMALEILQGNYSAEIDIWSTGVVMYVLLSGAPPFWGVTEQRIYKAIQKGGLSFPSNPWDDISSSAKDLIAKMLHPNAKSRITTAEALKHPWILLHTNDAKQNQLNSASDGFASLAHENHKATFDPQTVTVASTHNQTAFQDGENNAFTTRDE
ncbi:hypothetical protein GOP47_0023699 [Adiantum capillus-veneris]|uniref:Protein kinase domain-containing protein n=1 Tax=Adiantum capillus-veneris TaxID=13818 RepID=A0A9D4Z4Q1_ADICA|nr:hypothetical protein GOP47_0023699 [Adiantum capillus-veneris]